jgi:hypothetical protein
MNNKVSTCLYIDRGVLETARNVGLNVSRVAENALVEPIDRLTGLKSEAGLVSRAPKVVEGRGRDLNPGARLHRPMGYQATSPRPLFHRLDHFWHVNHINHGLFAFTVEMRRGQLSRFCCFRSSFESRSIDSGSSLLRIT